MVEELGFDVNEESPSNDSTTLSSAAGSGRSEILQYLLSHSHSELVQKDNLESALCAARYFLSPCFLAFLKPFLF